MLLHLTFRSKIDDMVGAYVHNVIYTILYYTMYCSINLCVKYTNGP